MENDPFFGPDPKLKLMDQIREVFVTTTIAIELGFRWQDTEQLPSTIKLLSKRN